jgi:hypothetical protein
VVGHFETRKDGRITIENRDETVRLTIYDKVSPIAVANLYPDAALKLAELLFEATRARRPFDQLALRMRPRDAMIAVALKTP